MIKRYKNVEEAYNKSFSRLVAIARRHLINTDYAIDCVHNVFLRIMILRGNNEAVKDYYLMRDVTREAFKMNRRITNDLFYCGGSIQESDAPTDVDSQSISIES
jgi:hypothetical protein